MVCPNCGNVLAREELEDRDVDICPACRGIWCPTGSVGWYIRIYGQLNDRMGPKGPVKCEDSLNPQARQNFVPAASCLEEVSYSGNATETLNQGTKNGRNCPSCSQSMSTFNYDTDSKISLDKCPSCNGVWLDADKVDMLLFYLKPEQPRPSQDAGQPYHQQTSTFEANNNVRYSDEDTEPEERISAPIIRRILGIPYVEKSVSIVPLVTSSIIAINVFIYFFFIDVAIDKSAVFSMFGFTPGRLLSEPLVTFCTYFSSLFVHADVGHLIGNMIFLWLFGTRIEEDYGYKAFITFYLISGVAAGLVHTLFSLSSPIPLVGASGAISGVLGAFLVLHPRNRVIVYVLFVPIRMIAAVYLGIWFTMQILNSIVAASIGSNDIAWFAHIGGFLAGVVMAYPLKEPARAVTMQVEQAA